MPELPEVETVKLGLGPVLEGALIDSVKLNRSGLRFPFPKNFKKGLTGQKITSVGRRAKYLMVDLISGDVLVMHLGMSGSFRVEDSSKNSKPDRNIKTDSKNPVHDHVIFKITGSDGSSKRIIYNDPRRFGYMDLIPRNEMESHQLFANLGIEPLGNSFDAEYLCDMLKDRKTPLKSALLDQRIIAGLGNIYVCESLWRSKLSPLSPAGSLTDSKGKPTGSAKKLVDSIRAVLTDAIRAGGSSLRDHISTDGKMGYFQHSFSVYDREGENCPDDKCNGMITRLIQSGRSTFCCTECQLKKTVQKKRIRSKSGE